MKDVSNKAGKMSENNELSDEQAEELAEILKELSKEEDEDEYEYLENSIKRNNPKLHKTFNRYKKIGLNIHDFLYFYREHGDCFYDTPSQDLYIEGSKEYSKYLKSELGINSVYDWICLHNKTMYENPILKISHSKNHIGVLTKSKDLYLWGLNTNGQLGTGDLISRLAPFKINDQLEFAEDENIADFALGNDHTVIVTNKNKLLLMGKITHYFNSFQPTRVIVPTIIELFDDKTINESKKMAQALFPPEKMYLDENENIRNIFIIKNQLYVFTDQLKLFRFGFFTESQKEYSSDYEHGLIDSSNYDSELMKTAKKQSEFRPKVKEFEKDEKIYDIQLSRSKVVKAFSTKESCFHWKERIFPGMADPYLVDMRNSVEYKFLRIEKTLPNKQDEKENFELAENRSLFQRYIHYEEDKKYLLLNSIKIKNLNKDIGFQVPKMVIKKLDSLPEGELLTYLTATNMITNIDIIQLVFSDFVETYYWMSDKSKSDLRELQKTINNDCEKDNYPLLKMRVEDLDLSVRSYNCLKRAGINTVGDLVEKPIDFLRNIRGLNNKIAHQILQTIEDLGLSMKPYDMLAQILKK